MMVLPFVINEFPSHIGSRSTQKRTRPKEPKAQCFHPTLVLAQLELSSHSPIAPRSFHPTLVLAQRAFSVDCERAALKFPSHIGSRSTKSLKQSERLLMIVSIPHWFSLNDFKNAILEENFDRFHPTLVLAQLAVSLKPSTVLRVSIPHWFSLNLPVVWETLVQFGVSIPHWFSLNPAHCAAIHGTAQCFHPTLVLAQQTIKP